MIRFSRAAIAAAAIVLSSCSLFGGSTAPEAPARQAPVTTARAPLQPGQWAQAATDVPAAPEIRFGSLPNGMRYAIRRNATPPGQAALRLRVDVGSLVESDAQQGLAHFLEHMAFNGSNAIPEGEMIKTLERHGLAFGADTNASTSWDETVYMLDLPNTDAETVDVSLKIMRETASELTIAADAVDRERGVILSEERTRDSPAYRIFKQRLGFFLKGQRPPQRYPIGTAEVLQNAPREEIVELYKKYYRPERATLVAVGDFDPDVMEAKIRQTFGDWQVEGEGGSDPEPGPVLRRGAEALVAVEPGSQLGLQIAWVSEPDLTPDTLARRKADWRERLGFAVLNRRLERLARAEDAPFIAAAGFRQNQFKAAEITTLAVTAKPGDWKSALAAVEREQRRAVQYGVRQDELDREIEEYRARLRAAAAGAETRRTPAIASEIVSSLEEERVVTSPAQDLALFEEVVKDLKAEPVSAALRQAFTGSGPLVFLATPTAVPGGEAAVLAALKESQAVAVTPPEAPTVVSWPYDSFGPIGKVVEQREVTDLDTVFVRFANGVRLTVKPTKFRDEQVLVKVNTGRGRLSQPADRQSLSWASLAVMEGGTRQMSSDDIERVLASKVVGSNFAMEDQAYVLSGETRTGDLVTQLQLLAAYASEPGWRPEGFSRIKTYVATLHDQYEATDSGVFNRDLLGLLHAGDRRWTFPSRQEIAASTLGDLSGQVSPALTSGPLEVVIVGDITVEKAIDAVAATFGALPPRPEPAAVSSAAAQTGFPAPGGPTVLTHKGRKDQSIAYVAWRTDDFFSNPQQARNVAILGEVMEILLTEELREAQGSTYSPNVTYAHSYAFEDWGFLSAQVEIPPARIDAFFADVMKIAAELREAPISADLLGRAKNPRRESLDRIQHTNEYWLTELSGAQADPRKLDAIRALIPGTERVSAADVQAAARKFLTPEKAWKLVVRPER
ncbi:MAG TPA: insulinase family protein [Caulobacteraceae bacterium]|nr:insulinase family protein [Caulobacteraceae bacterium]